MQLIRQSELSSLFTENIILRATKAKLAHV